jgi:Holliday junction DNA helicase RuvA
MIGKLTGRFGGATAEGAALVDVGGVGYLVRVPLTTLQVLRERDGECSLFVHTVVREDVLDLYGFASEGELSFFKQLTSVSGVGPKTALGILNVADVSTLRRSIARGDASMLTKVFGVGKKSAERIVVELRDKLAEQAGTEGYDTPGGDDGEVLEALMALGYSAAESRKALKAVASTVSGVHNRLTQALRQLGGRS